MQSLSCSYYGLFTCMQPQPALIQANKYKKASGTKIESLPCWLCIFISVLGLFPEAICWSDIKDLIHTYILKERDKLSERPLLVVLLLISVTGLNFNFNQDAHSLAQLQVKRDGIINVGQSLLFAGSYSHILCATKAFPIIICALWCTVMSLSLTVAHPCVTA